ncbi:hypothetical protein M0M57_10815 [Flavobacterium azooxidireducens]|uniref:Uncharacterized protein n=1 Tax=Flavobacterium azooxidireducens TaxID=1871076 RepID=A0ABY4KBF2_9FLAO|nr:hypothetical protein [Flavobacterium azooxidireducens]UPQ78114.1 hypothetical protein M0M57_10815 [Flavobacterium azooxidireducens]
MSLSSTFPSFEDLSGFNNSPFGAFWEKEEAQKMNFKLLTNNSIAKENNLAVSFSLALATDTPTIDKKVSKINGIDNFTVFIVAKSGTIKNFSGTTKEASEFTGLKIENIIEIRAVELGYNLLGSSLSKETIQKWVNEYDKWMNPSGFFSSEQLDYIYKEAVNYYENNKFTILTQPVTNKILIMLLEALRKDLKYYFNEDYVAKFLQQIALEFKSKAMITDPNRWNPYLANQERNPDYDPYFITNINAEKIRMEDAVQQFEGLLDQSALDVLLISALQTKVPLEIRSLLSAIYKSVRDGFIEMYQDAKAMLQTFADLPEMYNAFLVGLYNGLIRFLASLIEMIGFFVSLANPGNWESFVEGFKKFFSEIWSTLKTLIAAYFKKFTVAQNPIDFIKIFVEEITGIAIELFLLYVSLGVSATKKIAEGLEQLLKNPKATVEDWMDYFKKRKKEDSPENPPNLLDEVDDIVGNRKKTLDDVESGKIKLDEDANGNKRKKGDETRSSNYAEMKVDDYFETQKFVIGKNEGTLKRVSENTVSTLDDSIKKGIDGIYEFSTPPPKYVIAEVKYNTATLSKTTTKSGGAQMSEQWVKYDLNFGAVSAEIRREILVQGYEPLLCTVSKQGKVTVNTINQTLTEATKSSVWEGKVT